MNKSTGTSTICYISCLIFYGCLGAVLESGSECFIPGGGIKLRVQEYLPEYIKCRENISVFGKNVSVITDAFSELKAHVLSLKRNNIEAIQEGAFRGSSITVLDLSKNLLKCIFKNQLDINDLKNLNLAENRISYIESGAFIETLTILNLEKNHLTEFDMYEFPRMKNIRQLNIAQNGLILLNLKKDILIKLERLDLGYNDLHQFDFSDLLSLSYLDLGNNNLRNLQSNLFLNLNNLLDLDFSNNKIEDLGFMVNNFPRLNSLKLQNNNIEKIQDDIFVRSLGELDLSGNNLQYFNFTNNELRKVKHSAISIHEF
ncbi:hypothetical protein JTB14_023046 [Gonioctena quinquepunctata]|nr:hypothetical protein JTB14_023046 [Gonioctena quinquepunctata]